MIQLLIIDDHPLVRQGIRTLAEADPKIEVVGEAACGEDGIRQAESLRPNVATLDLSMPGMSGLAALKHLKERFEMAVVVVSMHPEEDYGLHLLRAGADGYVSKGALGDVLLTAIHKAHGREKFFSQETLGHSL